MSASVRYNDSAPGPSVMVRPYLELEVSSVDRSADFYSVLMDRQPVSKSGKSVRFDLDEPHLSLVLNEVPGAVGRDGHLGVQLKYIDDVRQIRERLQAHNVAVELEEEESSCCFSVANKVWVADPDKNLWEIYVLLEQHTQEVRCGASCACESSGCG